MKTECEKLIYLTKHNLLCLYTFPEMLYEYQSIKQYLYDTIVLMFYALLKEETKYELKYECFGIF